MKSNWQHLSLKDAGISLIDCVHKTPKAKDDGYPYVAIPQIKDGRIDLSSTRKISHAGCPKTPNRC
jgi:type I restriction enzyme S subunit